MAYPLFHEAGPPDRPTSLAPERLAAAFPAESEHVEFSRTLLEPHVHDNVTAFSNTDGGVILLGVRHDGAILDQAPDESTFGRIHEVIAEVRDPGRYTLHRLAAGDATLVVIAVDRRREGFAQTPDGRVLVRREAVNVPLLGAELTTFVAARTPQRFEASAVGPTLDEADPALLKAHGWASDELPARLHEAGLLTTPALDAPLTVAGALVLLLDPTAAVGAGRIEAERFDDDGVRRAPLTLAGPAHRLVDEATRTVLEALGTDSVTVREQPHELPRLPELAVHEAIANAVIHRSYEPGAPPVQVQIHRDRVVVRSPGALPEPVTLHNLRPQSAPRNPALAEVLRRLGATEGKGRGVGVMIDTMTAHLLEAPVFADDDGHVVVELRTASEATPQERAWMAETSQRVLDGEQPFEKTGPLGGDERALLLLAVRGEVLTNAKVRAELDVDVTTARLALQQLRNRGFLVQSGQLGGASYVLAEGLAPLAGPRLAHRQLQKVVLTMAVKGGVTNEQIRERTGLQRRETEKLLRELVAAGRLVRRGSRRGTYYTLG